MEKSGRARVGVDIGGTFTDFALEIDGRRYTAKALTTPATPDRAVLEGLAVLLTDAQLTSKDVGLIIHGTTLATNALIERKGARTAMITTEGFRDVVESGFESRYEQYNLWIDLPKPLVPRRWRFTVPERIDAAGRVRMSLDLDAVRALVPVLQQERIEAVAVGFLHSYANPAHELAAGAILTELLPGISVSLSSVVSPEMREYERFSTACANAYVQPKMARYITSLESGLSATGINCPLLLMLSGGGVTTVDVAVRFPVRLVESGPAGGAIFSSQIAKQRGYERVLSFDMGGTTAKVCLIDAFEPQTSRTFEVARMYRFKKGSGLPLRIPVIEMVEIGAGGGSVAGVDEMKQINVGPESAGSEPGPACYCLGGESPTVTDADVVLGRIDPVAFAGGKMPLDKQAAEVALATFIGKKLGISAVLAAFGVSEIVDENMANAARIHGIESGKDVAERTLIAFGGAAPLHAARVAEKLNVKSFVVPANAGVGSAVGLLRAPVSYEIVRSDHQRLESFDVVRASALLSEMAAQARGVVERAAFGVPLEEHRTAFMRYIGQGHEIAVGVPAGTVSEDLVKVLRAAFEAEYSRLYRRTVPGEVEVLTWALRVSVTIDRHVASRPNGPSSSYEPVPDAKQRVFDPETGAFALASVFKRDGLRPGAIFNGPAVVSERETTTIVSGRFKVRVDSLGSLECIRISPNESN